MDSKKSYVRYISHELRTPLSAAFLGLKLLTTDLKASRDPRDVERYDTLYDINMSCVAAVDILNDLLCYDKLGSGSLELHKEEIIVESYLQSSLSMFTAQANESGVTLSFAPQSNNHDNTQNGAFRVLGINRIFLPLHVTDLIIADKFKIDQVLRNVISNALKFTSRGGSVTLSASFMPDIITETPSPVVLSKPKLESGSKLRDSSDSSISNMTKEKTRKKQPYKWFRSSSSVHCGAVKDDSTYGMLVIIITDTGAGISIENQVKLFKEIIQFSPEKLQAGGGSGLGLWISDGILKMHNGKISVFSEGEGHGCSFTIQIPMIRQQSTLVVCNIPPPLFVTAVTRAYNDNDNNYDLTNNSNDLDSYVNSNNNNNDDNNNEHKNNDHNNNNNNENNCNDENNDNDKSIEEGKGDEFDSNDYYDIYTDKPKCTYCPSPNLDNNTSEVYQLPPLELLVVDDSPVNCKMLMKCLKSVGHSCVSGSDGLMAIAMVKERIDFVNGGNGRPYDAILMDFMMPNMDGPSATKIIRSMGYTAPILGLTGNGQ